MALNHTTYILSWKGHLPPRGSKSLHLSQLSWNLFALDQSSKQSTIDGHRVRFAIIMQISNTLPSFHAVVLDTNSRTQDYLDCGHWGRRVALSSWCNLEKRPIGKKW